MNGNLPEETPENSVETPVAEETPMAMPAPPLTETGEEIVAEGPEAEEHMRQVSRRAFLQAGVVTVAGIGGVYLFNKYAPMETTSVGPDIKTLFRRGHEVNEAVARRAFFSENHRAQEFPRDKAVEPRNNYHGDTPTPDLDQWKLIVEGAASGPASLSFADLKDLHLPEISATTELKCVEGWSVIVNWTGVRLADFMAKFPPPPGTAYVAMRSEPDGFDQTWYYVGLDMPSCQHPQTLLAYAMNDAPLTPEHGAPLRLVIPHKYGIKNIKLITHIGYAKEKPADYWADRGYDYYAGL